MGDFNEILATCDHSRQRHNRLSGMYDFQQLVLDCGLMDLCSSGQNFTWLNNQENYPISKKLDRVLVNAAWISTYPNSYANFETNGISDHARAVITSAPFKDSRKTSFKFFNYIIDLPDFKDIVGRYWSSTDVLFQSRTALHLFHKKLKFLKPILRAINRNRYSEISKRTKQAFNELCQKQEQALKMPTHDSFSAVSEATERWDHFADLEEKFYKQKSCNTWLECGDRNTAFFHNTVKARNTGNSIKVLTTPDGRILADHDEIKEELVDFYKGFLQAPPYQRPINDVFMEDLITYRCPTTKAETLTRLVTSEEIKRVVFSMPANKSSGPDGYTAEFFKATWEILGADFVTAIQSFFFYCLMPKGINATALALIPKINDATLIRDYRPISCCNIIYKVISKILANRLSPILPDAIEPNQSAFIKGRLLLENVLLATELVKDYHKSNISPRSCLKLDISKAFDTMRWDFIIMTLRTMRIPEIFINWVYACISSASFSLRIHGQLEGFFQSTRGIRQGCSLSPYLYDIVNNVLALLLNRSAKEGKIGYHPYCEEVSITHLSFADDTLVFFDGTERSLQGIMSALSAYASCSGLVINLSKSAIYKAGRISAGLISRSNTFGF